MATAAAVATESQEKSAEPAVAQRDGGLHDGRSNWERLKGTIAAHNAAHPLAIGALTGATAAARKPFVKRRKVASAPPLAEGLAACADGVLGGRLAPKGGSTEGTAVVGLDCEMVGVGLDGLRSALARVCVVRCSLLSRVAARARVCVSV